MKKSLVALATLAVAGVASAQSSVTLFGIVDAGVSYYDAKPNNGGATQKTWQQTNSGYNSSRLGFRGTEDLGGGLAAGFWLEAALGNDTGAAGGGGTQLFNRRSTVSLSGPFGEVRIGRDYVATFWNDTAFDPFGTNGVGTNVISSTSGGNAGRILPGVGITDGNYVRANNMVAYFLPANLGGFYGQAQYGFNERVDNGGNPLDSKTGGYAGGRFGYANGPLDVAIAYGESDVADTFGVRGSTTNKTLNLGASYDLGVVKLFTELSKYETDLEASNVTPSVSGYLLGATAPVGAGLIRVSFSQAKGDYDVANRADPKSSKFAIGYVHNLSKRTALYATYARVENKNGANSVANGTFNTTGTNVKNSNGYDFGIRHAF